MVIAGKGNQNHKYQRYYGKNQNSHNGQCHQERMQILLKQRSDVILKAGDMLPLCLTYLGTVSALSRHAGDEDDAGSQNQRNYAVEQAEHGIISQCILVNSQSLVVHLPLFHGAQRDEITQRTHAEYNHINKIQNFQRQEDSTPDNLLIQNIAKSENKEGQPGHGIAFFKYL